MVNNNLYSGGNGEFTDSEAQTEAKKQFEKIRQNSTKGLKKHERRIFIGFIVVLCLSLILGAFAIMISYRSTLDLDYLYNYPLKVRANAHQLNTYVLRTYLDMDDLASSEAGDINRIRDCIDRVEYNMSQANNIFAVLRTLASEEETLRPSFDELGTLLDELEIIRRQSQEFAMSGDMEKCRENVDYYGDLQVGKINECLMEIVSDSSDLAAESYNNILADSKRNDVYTVFLTMLILVPGLIILIYIKRHLANSIRLVDEAQRDQAEILDELAIMDEHLRQNLSELEHKSEVIEHMAYYDSLTNLPNRIFFTERLKEALHKSRENRTSGCVLLIDLDNFQMINDSHGHDFGDKLLLEVSLRLQATLGEQTLIARFGGDEFLVLFEDITGEEYVRAFILRIIEALDKPFMIEGISFNSTASIGVAIFPEDGRDAVLILKNSDSAMYASKYAGRNTFAFYNKSMSDKVVRKSAIGDILHNAIENDSVYMVYQPQYHSTLCRVVGLEALMRISEKSIGPLNPAEFIPVAEETRLIIPLGYWALREAIKTDIELRKQGLDIDYMSVNVSEIQIQEPDFAENVKKIIEEYNYDATRLHLEVTESVLINDMGKDLDVFEELHKLGIKIELDDFGTGYSSLNYVRAIPLDALKIDKCFIDEIGVNDEKESLIDLIIRLARTFEANVVAEGVETAEQVEFLKQKGDVIVQGYYYSKPLEVSEIPDKVNALNRLNSLN